jgi:hypothetical protein
MCTRSFLISPLSKTPTWAAWLYIPETLGICVLCRHVEVVLVLVNLFFSCQSVKIWAGCVDVLGSEGRYLC